MKVSPFSIVPSTGNRTTLKARLNPQSHSSPSDDTVHFGMFKRKIKEATTRRDRVIINPHATDYNKREAQDHLERVKKAAEAPEKFHKNTKVGVRIGQGVITGAATLAATAHGMPTDPETTHAVIENGMMAIIGTTAGTAVRLTSTDPIADAITDKKYPELHYPTVLNKATVVGWLTQYVEDGRSYFDENGDRWEMSPAQVERVIKEREDWLSGKNTTSEKYFRTEAEVARNLQYKGRN
jgi:hypothetical protein